MQGRRLARLCLRPALLLGLCPVLLLASSGLADPLPAAAQANNAEDYFVRADTSAGWGATTNADGIANLPWQGDFASSSLTVISGDTGRINVTTKAHPLVGWLGVTSAVGGDSLGEVSFSAAGHAAAALLLQRAGTGQFYEAVLDTSARKLELIRRTGGVNTVVGTPFALTATAGTKYWIRLDAQSSGGSEVLSARVWADGSTEPTNWQTSYTDASPLGAGEPGALGIWSTTGAAGEHIDFHAFATAASGLAVPPTPGSANGQAPTFTADSPGSAVVGTAYSYTFAATGNPAPTYSVASGTLPAGLSLDPASGVLSGTPTTANTYSFTIQADNGVSPAATTPPLQIAVNPNGPTVTTSVLGGAQGTPAPTSGVTPGTLVPVSQGPPGTRIILTGTGFKGGEKVQPVWYNGGTQIKMNSFYEMNPIGTADSNGAVKADMFVPDIYGGSHTIGLLGVTSGTLATTSFTVTARLDVGATQAPAGTVLAVNGWGFGARESVTVSFNGTAITTGTTDTKGAFSKKYTVPSGTAAGSYTFSATGATSGITTSTPFTVGAVSAGAGPQASDWATWGFDPQNHRVNPTETAIGPGNVATLAPLWTRPVFAPDKVTGAINQANGVSYVGTVHGVVYALNPRTGAILWMYQALGSVYESPAIANGLVYFSTVNNPNEGVVGNYTYALDAGTGALVWAQWLPIGAGWDTPTVTGNHVVVEGANKEAVSGGMTSFDPLTGSVQWSFASKSPDTGGGYAIWAPGTVNPSGTTLYQDTGNPCVSAGVPGDSCSGYLLAVDLATGNYTQLYHFPDVSGDDDVPTSPAYDNGNLFIGSKNGFEYSIAASTGAINWSFNTSTTSGCTTPPSKPPCAGDFGIFSSAVVNGGRVIFGSGDRRLYALDENTGAQLWQASIGNGLIYSSPVQANGVLYVASMSNSGTTNLAALDPATGNILWSYSMSSMAENSPTVSNGILLVGDDSGTLYAFTPGGA